VSIYLPHATAADTMHLLALQTSYVAAGRGDSTGAVQPARRNHDDSVALPDGGRCRERAGERCRGRIRRFDHGRRELHDGHEPQVAGRSRAAAAGATRVEPAPAFSIRGSSETASFTRRGPRSGTCSPRQDSRGFDRDVLAQAGVRHVIVLLGINDIGHPGSAAPETDEVSAEEIEAGLRQFVVRAHEKGHQCLRRHSHPFRKARPLPASIRRKRRSSGRR